MKWYIFKRFLFLAVLLNCMAANALYAENIQNKKKELRHERKLDLYKKGWAKLIPQYEKLQFAGGMGVMSIGIGWDYGRREQWETDLLVGYLPKYDADRGYATFTVKENYIPWDISLKNHRWAIEPFTASIYINKIFGDEFWGREPDKYPHGYYTFMTNLRIHLAFGQRFRFKLRPFALSDSMTFFYEFGTNDLYLISYLTNKSLHINDIFTLSLGLKFKFI